MHALIQRHAQYHIREQYGSAPMPRRRAQPSALPAPRLSPSPTKALADGEHAFSRHRRLARGWLFPHPQRPEQEYFFTTTE